MSFFPHARNTKVRTYYDFYVPRPKGAKPTAQEVDAIPEIGEVADILGIEHRHVSDGILRDVGFVKVAAGKYYTTDEHRQGWDAEVAKAILDEYLAERRKLEPKPRPRRGRPPKVRAVQAEPEDWSLFHYWEAITQALEELGANSSAKRREVTYEIKPKLAEHKVGRDDIEVGAILPIIRSRLGWVGWVGADPAGWYLTDDYYATSPAERATLLAQWDDRGNPVTRTPVQPTYEEGTIMGIAVVPSPEGRVLITHRWEWDGAPFGAPEGTKVTIEANLPKEQSAQERLGLFEFVKKLHYDLINLI